MTRRIVRMYSRITRTEVGFTCYRANEESSTEWRPRHDFYA